MTFLESLHRKLQVIACYMYVFAILDFICEINLLDNLVNNRWKAMLWNHGSVSGLQVVNQSAVKCLKISCVLKKKAPMNT